MEKSTPPLLSKFKDDVEKRLKDFEKCPIVRNVMETSDVTDAGVELVLYQTGYLTIKDYLMGIYILGFPNTEVRKALYKLLCVETGQ